jgi:integral membrane sensor domain MASE1
MGCVFWPAAGVSSGVLIALGRDARLPVAAGAMVATIAANLTGDRNVWSATAFAFCNAGEALLVDRLIERYCDSPFTLDRLRNVLRLLAAAVVATAASAIGGTVAVKLFHTPTAPIWTTWLHWFASDVVGIMIVAPPVIGLAEAVREPPPRNEMAVAVVVHELATNAAKHGKPVWRKRCSTTPCSRISLQKNGDARRKTGSRRSPAGPI